MPPQLHDTSPTTTTMNLPNQFNIGEAAATATIMALPEAVPQRERFRVNNVTQPFTVDQNEENNQGQPPPPLQVSQQQRTTTTWAFRGRRRQRQYCQIDNNNNRFAVLSDNNNDNDIVDDDDDDEDTDDKPVSMSRNKKMKNKNKKKKRIYFEPTSMLRWLEDRSKSAISGRGNQVCVSYKTHL